MLLQDNHSDHHERRTKIVATLGPATDTPEKMEQLLHSLGYRVEPTVDKNILIHQSAWS